jgi:hypothetical protein
LIFCIKTPQLTSVTTFRFPSNATLQPKKRKKVKLFAFHCFLQILLQLDNYLKNKEISPVKKTKFSSVRLKPTDKNKDCKACLTMNIINRQFITPPTTTPCSNGQLDKVNKEQFL